MEIRQSLSLFVEWAASQAIEYISEDILKKYAIEKVGYWEAASNLPDRDREKLRALRMLCCFMKHEPFECRIPLLEHRFYTLLKNYIQLYLQWCENERGYRPTTIKSRQWILCRYDNFLYEKKLDINDVSVDINEEFFSSDACGNRISYKSTIRDMLQYMYDSGFLKKDLSPYVLKEPKRFRHQEIPTTYTTEEIKCILESIDRSTAKGKRDYLVVLLAAEYGMRASDIVRLSPGHIDWEDNAISFNQFKTGVRIQYPLLASVGNAIIDYLQNGRPKNGDDVIIVSHENLNKGKQLSSPTIHSIVTAGFRGARIPNWQNKKHGPHSLRFSLASNMLKQGIGFHVISSALGHASSESTKTYVKIDIERLRQCSLSIPAIHNIWLSAGKEMES